MEYQERKAAVVLLADGTRFYGKSIGITGTSQGEICFNTGMTGYQEIFTDPSYAGQLMLTTNAHIGNYGTVDDEQESSFPQISGVIINEYSEIFSRSNSDESLEDYFIKNNTVAIYDIDTRKLVKHIRDKGAMNCIISSVSQDVNSLKKTLDKVPSMKNLELSSKVTTKEEYEFGDKNSKIKIAVLDLGCKKSILKNFSERGALCKVFPAKTTYDKMCKWNPDGFFISNGPGDPASMDYAVNTVREILKNDRPIFGICLGHQILARACDISTYKLHNGHRGINHPVKNLISGKSEVTSQNHGFSVSVDDIKESDILELTHVNLNDDTVEGIKVKDKKAFSVQYHPESCPGPHDSRYLFDEFIQLIKND